MGGCGGDGGGGGGLGKGGVSTEDGKEIGEEGSVGGHGEDVLWLRRVFKTEVRRRAEWGFYMMIVQLAYEI